ncbi:MAG: RNA 2',3'-cyclic phosphodiesterase [Planctomycetes bacterium]|nr:RNA 2',3'-cyclic phosphodiesterase [Planctomycetota bacterium]
MPRVRTFLAIEVDDAVRGRLVSLQEQLAVIAPDVKWVEPENLHVTLLFLGEVEQRETLDICRAAQKAVAEMPAFAMSVEGAGCFPNARRPRTLWVGVGMGAHEVGAVHDAIEKPLMEMGSYRRETRAYVPHITLGRVKGDQATDELAKTLVKHKTWSAGETNVRDVCVMSSVLTPEGPTYAVLGRAKLLA